MSETLIQVNPGAISTLQMALGSGSTIQNQNPNNAVWVSNNPALVPGVGTKIGPLGSLTWTTPGVSVFATVDTGVITPVMLSVSSDITQPVNPVDVATATAAQLLKQGIPNVMLTDTVVPMQAISKGSTIDLTGMSKYASLVFGFSDSSSTQAYTITFLDTGMGWTFSDMGVPPFNGLSITVPVMGDHLQVSFHNTSVPGTIGTLVQGTNRPVASPTVGGGTGSLITSIPSRAWNTGNQFAFTDYFLSTGGPATVFVRTDTATVCKGYLMMWMYNDNVYGTPNGKAIMPNNGNAGPPGYSENFGTLYLPPGRLQFQYYNYTAATFQVDLNITQSLN